MGMAYVDAEIAVEARWGIAAVRSESVIYVSVAFLGHATASPRALRLGVRANAARAESDAGEPRSAARDGLGQSSHLGPPESLLHKAKDRAGGAQSRGGAGKVCTGLP